MKYQRVLTNWKCFDRGNKIVLYCMSENSCPFIVSLTGATKKLFLSGPTIKKKYVFTKAIL